MPILEPKRDYLKVTDVKTGDTIEFATEGEWIESKKWTYDDGTPKQSFVIGVEINGWAKEMTLNSTNRNVLIEAWGKDTAQWVGKKASIEKIKVNVGGQLKESMLLKAVTQ